MVESERARSLHFQTLGGSVLLLAIPILIGVVMWLVAQQAEQREGSVRHTLQVELSLERLLFELRTAESNQRAFLLTGNQDFRNVFQSAADAARNEISQLEAFASDNQAQQATLSRLRPVLEGRFNELAAASAQNPASGANSRDAARRVHRGEVQALIDEMFQSEERQRVERQLALNRAERRFYWILFLGCGLILLIVAALYRSVRRHGIQSAQAEARLSALNAELDERVRQRTALLHAREELLNIFVRYVPAAVAMLDREMRYLQVSDRWCSDFGIEREGLIGHCHYEVFPDIPDRWKTIHRRCLGGETLRADEDPWEHDGRTVWLRWEVRPWGARDGLPEGLLVFSEDITARKEIEEALRESEATNRTLLDTAAQGILAVDRSGAIVQANKMVGEIFGYASNELLGQPHEILILQGLRERHRAHREAFMAAPTRRAMGSGIDLVGVRKDGTEFPIEVSLSGLETKRGLLAVSFVSDITVRKEAEKKLLEREQKLRELAGSLLSAQEEERRKLARELHDDVTQQLAFLSIELGRLGSELPDPMSEARARIKALQTQTLRASSEVRRISHGLHPSVITDFGLSVALEEFCQEFEKAHGIQVVFEGSLADSRLNDTEATCLYRIAQESMRNSVVHGHATEVRVSLHIANGAIQLRVQDNGIGSQTNPARNRTGLGMVSMMERVRLVNGTVHMASEPGYGTAITASVPLTEVLEDESKDSAR